MFSEFIRSAERAFTDPGPRRGLFVAALIGTALLLNHCTGFIHHYDTRSEIQEIKDLKELRGTSIEGDEELRGLYRSVLEDVKQRQVPIAERIANFFEHVGDQITSNLPNLLIRTISATFIYLFWFMYSLLRPQGGVAVERGVVIMGLLPFIVALLITAYLLPEVGTIGGTAATLTHIQLFSLFSLALYGAYRRRGLTE